jgi:flagellar protein FliO/FliZ
LDSSAQSAPQSATAETAAPAPPTLPTATTAPGGPAVVPGGSSGFSAGPVAAGLLLAALAAVALVLARRRRQVPRLVEVLESASLGPKRSLVLARLGDEVVLLGSSEGGITLLSSRPAKGLVPEYPAEQTSAAEPELSAPSRFGRHLFQDLFPKRRSPESPAFEGYLAESVEDVELRRKLAAGQAGNVR